MSRSNTPRLEQLDAQAIMAQLVALVPGYTRDWKPTRNSPGYALMQIFARYLQALAERIGDAPDRNLLAFLDMLGVNLSTAQAARAPVVFEAMPFTGNGRVPARTRLGAKSPGSPEPLVFETESAIALAAAHLVEIVTLWPGKDMYADHTIQALKGQPFTLFKSLKPVPHILYLGHDTHFALAGKASVEIQFDLAATGTKGFDIAWEYWDGKVWRGFKPLSSPQTISPGDSLDGTDGLRRSGTIHLVSDCAESKRTKVSGLESYWLRGRLAGPLPQNLTMELPLVDTLGVSTVIERPVSADCTDGFLPEEALAEGQKADLTKTFKPLGQAPALGTSFYFSSEEAFSKPGAEVTVCIKKAITPEEKLDKEREKYEDEVTSAAKLLKDIQDKVACVKAGLKATSDILAAQIPSLFPAGEPEQWYQSKVLANVRKARDEALRAGPPAVVELNALLTIIGLLRIPVAGIPVTTPAVLLAAPAALGFADAAAIPAARVLIGIMEAVKTLSPDPNTLPGSIKGKVDDLLRNIDKIRDALNKPTDLDRITALPDALISLPGAWQAVVNDVANWPIYLPDQMSFVAEARTNFNSVVNIVTSARTALQCAQASLEQAILLLDKMTPVQAAHLQGAVRPTLQPPRLTWQYWNGSSWQTLVGPVADKDRAENFQGDGSLTFRVPDDWEPCAVSDKKARWMRVQLVSGSYGHLRLISWLDAQTKIVNFSTIIEPRPPTLDMLSLGYTWRSTREAPQHCLAYNDFQWTDHTQDARWPGGGFAAYRPVEDRTPAIYLGFDQPLPADLLSLYIDVQEVAGREEGFPLRWEYYRDTEWLPLSIGQDETHYLALPGMVTTLWPGTPAPPKAAVAQASGTRVQLEDARQGAHFAPGDSLLLTRERDNELVTVESVLADAIALRAPLNKDYQSGQIEKAQFARFGTPRTWIRVRLQTDREPLMSGINGIFLNSVWAVQTQSIENELLGSSTGQPNLPFFFRHTPVLERTIVEVRELDGLRAQVELPMLREELAAQGLSESDIRTQQDLRTGRINEVWVRWQERPHLFSSGPNDRHYTIERNRGRLLFGDKLHGKIPPVGLDNIRARLYQSGGGVRGNVPIGAINQLLSGVLASAVSNPRPGEGGADSEDIGSVAQRGPLNMRHRLQALTPGDYEALAREASPAVAVARALPVTGPGGRKTPGHVKVLIMPHSNNPQPEPSFELRRHVRQFLEARMPASAAGQVSVEAPSYLPIGVEAMLAPKEMSEAGVVLSRVTDELARFFHPLIGGPENTGWPFGRDVYVSDVAALIAGVQGIDYVQTLNLTLEGMPQGAKIDVPPDHIVIAGQFRISLVGSER